MSNDFFFVFKLSKYRKFFLFSLFMVLFYPCVTLARPTRAAYIVDMRTNKVLYSRNANIHVYPASLTKMMTLYILFEKLKEHKIKFSTPIKISWNAASMEPTKLGLRPGSTINVRDAILAIVTKSANDVAAAVGENLVHGSERKFAYLMTRTAHRLGMRHTQFRNASGLPNRNQVTTARDMAILALHLKKDFPQYYRYFSIRYFYWKGKRIANHNHLLTKYYGTTGIKTGYTVASGFNLVAIVHRNGVDLIGVIFGEPTAATRDMRLMSLFDRFDRKTSSSSQRARMEFFLKKEKRAKRNSSLSTSTPWKIQVGAYYSKTKARTGIRNAIHKIPRQLSGKKSIILRTKSSKTNKMYYKPQFVGFKHYNDAKRMCYMLKKQKNECLVVKGIRHTKYIKKVQRKTKSSPWKIQVGAYHSKTKARTGIRNAIRKIPKQLKNKKSIILRTKSSKTNKMYYKSQFIGFKYYNDAKRMCHMLEKQKIECLVKKTA